MWFRDSVDDCWQPWMRQADETNIHYPTDSSLLGDGLRVWTRTMKKIGRLAGAVGDKLRDRSRSVQHRLIEIGRSSRSRGRPSRQKLEPA